MHVDGQPLSAHGVQNRRSVGEMKRVLVTGASGMLGRLLMKELESSDWHVQGFCSSRGNPPLSRCDLTEPGMPSRVVSAFRPHVVVHLAAERRPDAVQKNPEKARKLNVDVTGELAAACDRIGAWFLYVSTDYVFDGTSPPYAEDATPNPLNLHGKQKCEAEELARSNSLRTAVLRLPLLYGPIEFLGESAVTLLYEHLTKGLSTADNTQKRYPTYTADVAKIVMLMLNAHLAGKHLTGTFHWQSNECLTKFDMVSIIADIARYPLDGIAPDSTPPPYPRPEDSKLDCSRLEAMLEIDGAKFRTPFREAVEVSLRPFIRTKSADKVIGTLQSQGAISKDGLVSVVTQLDYSIKPGDLEMLFAAANKDNAQGFAFESFVRWLFQ